MTGDNFIDGSCKTRPVLGDLTNRPGKRGFSFISGDLKLKSGDGYGKNEGSDSGGSEFAKQVCLGVENFVKERCKARSEVDGKNKAMLNDNKSGTNNARENITPVNANKPEEIKETPDLSDSGVSVTKGDTITQNDVEVGDASRESCVSSVSVLTISGPCKKGCADGGKITSNTTQSNSTNEGLVNCVFRSDDKDVRVGRLASSKCGSIEWSRLPKSQSSRSFELDRCAALKGDDFADFSVGADLLKACSCSFCLKAAYIWSDLHYQDIKGRIAVLKKSQKEASALTQKNGRGNQIDICSQGNSEKSSKLESDLTGQWRSLFLNMEDILVRENSQLQASFVMLKDLRENCKMDLERSTGIPSEKY